MLLQNAVFLPQWAAPAGCAPILTLWCDVCVCLAVPASDSVPLCTSTLPSHHDGPAWDQSTGGRVGLPGFTPAFSEATDPFSPPGKGGFNEPHFGRKPWGLGTGSAACWVSHPPGICLGVRSCLVSLAWPQGATLPRHVPGTRCTSQGFPAAWHGHSSVPEASPKQWPAMSPCVMSLCVLSVGQRPPSLLVSASGCPSVPAEPWDHLKHG